MVSDPDRLFNDLITDIENNEVGKVRTFLEEEQNQGFDLNRYNEHGRAPLHYATSSAMVDLLMQFNANINIQVSVISSAFDRFNHLDLSDKFLIAIVNCGPK